MENTQQAQQPEIRTKFCIPEPNHQTFLKKIARLNKAATKLGVPEVALTLIEERKKPICNESGEHTGMYKIVYDYSVIGLTPKLAGWAFMAVVEPTPAGNLVRCVPGQDVDTSYQTATLCCQHCNKIRKRSAYFVVRHDDGSEKTVGRSCLKDFLGHGNPALIASMLEYVIGLSESEEDDLDYSGSAFWTRIYDQMDLIMWTAAIIEKYGFIPRSSGKESFTSSEVLYIMAQPDCRANRAVWEVARRDLEPLLKPQLAEYILGWLSDLERKDYRSNFENNLFIISKTDKITYKELGMFCAGVHCAMKVLDAEIAAREEKKNKSNEHVGEIGKRYTYVLTVTKTRSIDTRYRQYGTSMLFIMEDEKGNQFKWFASGERDMHKDGTYEIKGTVKAHDEYQGRNQTTLTRCSVIKELEKCA